MSEGDTTTETLEMEVVLDPEGLRSQLAHLKQQIGMDLTGASYSVQQTMGAFGAGFNSLTRDVGSLANAVMFQPTPTQDLGGRSASVLSGLVPSLTAPRSYDVAEWGQLHRDNIFKSTGDMAYRMSLAAPSAAAHMAGGALGFGAVSGFLGGGVAGFVGGALVGGMAGGALLGGAVDAAMDPLVGRYMAGQALAAGGARFGIANSGANLGGVEAARQAVGFSGAESATVLQAGLQTGAFGQVGSTQEFSTKFKDLMRGAKEVATIMHTELSDSVQTISALQSAGFGSIRGAVDAIKMSRLTASTSDITTREAVELSVAGAAMTVGNLGMSAQYGAAATRANFEGVTLGLREKSVDFESVTQLGGRARAAQAMTMSGLGFLESPSGRATLLAAYDTETGSLDPTKFQVEPGAAFRGAMDNVLSGANPMKTLLEFAGNRQRVASSASPEEVALGQASSWAALARNIDPKGPITNDMLVGAATIMGTNPDVARTIVGTVTDPSILQARQQELMKQAAASASAAAGRQGGLFGKGGTFGGQGPIDWYVGKVTEAYNTPYTAGSSYDPMSPAEVVAGAGGVWGGLKSMFNTGVGAVSDAVYGTKLPELIMTEGVLQASLPGENSLARDLAVGMKPINRANMKIAAGKARRALDSALMAEAGLTEKLVMKGSKREAIAALMPYMPQILATPTAEVEEEVIDAMANMDFDSGVVSDVVGRLVPNMFTASRGMKPGTFNPVGPLRNLAQNLRDVQDFTSTAAKAETSASGLRMLASQSAETREYVAEHSGGSAHGTMLRMAGKFVGASRKDGPDSDLVGIPALAGMHEDNKQISAMMGKGKSVTVEQLRGGNWDQWGYSFRELEAAAVGTAASNSVEGQTLTQRELSGLAARKMGIHGVSKGFSGSALTGMSGGQALDSTSMAAMFQRTARALDATEKLLVALGRKVDS